MLESTGEVNFAQYGTLKSQEIMISANYHRVVPPFFSYFTFLFRKNNNFGLESEFFRMFYVPLSTKSDDDFKTAIKKNIFKKGATILGNS